MEIIFRLCDFYEPRQNISGLFLRLASAYVDKATFDELGRDALQELLDQFAKEDVEFTSPYRHPKKDDEEENQEARWFTFDYHPPHLQF